MLICVTFGRKCRGVNRTAYNNLHSLLRTLQVKPVSTVPVRTMSKRSDSEHEDDIKAELERVAKNKGKYLKLSLDERRQKYACGKNYVPVNRIERWPDYYRKHAESLLHLNKKKVAKYEVDEELNSKVSLWTGDITRLEIDAIVNAANKSLLGGGGVDGAIHAAAGSLLYEECKSLGGCNTGSAKTTCGYELPARYVIHTVGPRDKSESKLRSCYRSCFTELQNNKLKSIAFCCISTGIYGYPNSEAVHVALDETRKHLMTLKREGQLSSIELIVFCLFLNVDLNLYKKEMQNYFPVPDEFSKNEKSQHLNKSSNASSQKSSSSSSFSSCSSSSSSSGGIQVISSGASSSVEIIEDEVMSKESDLELKSESDNNASNGSELQAMDESGVVDVEDCSKPFDNGDGEFLESEIQKDVRRN